jgi:hypothetical protein
MPNSVSPGCTICTAGVAVGAGVFVGAGVSTWGISVGSTVGVAKEIASEAGVGVGPVMTRPPHPIALQISTLIHKPLRHIWRHRRCIKYFIAALTCLICAQDYTMCLRSNSRAIVEHCLLC